MSQATMHRLHLSISRNRFEKLLGGEWETDKDNRNLRRNGKWETFTGPSRVLQGRRDKFVRNLRSGATRSGRSWRELAEALKLV
ncbi:MAG: hypothetical protein ACOC8X_11565 [Chloroflexota bacterium]